MSEETRNRTEIIADLVEARKTIYDRDAEIERLRAVVQEQATWLRKRGAELDEYVTTQHDYFDRAEVLEQALKGEK